MAMYLFPNRSCIYPTNGQIEAIVKVLATGSHPMASAAPTSAAMKLRVPPAKYRGI